MSRQRKYKKKTCKRKQKGGTRKREPPSRYDPLEIASQPQLKRQKSRTQQPTQGPTSIIAPTQLLTPTDSMVVDPNEPEPEQAKSVTRSISPGARLARISPGPEAKFIITNITGCYLSSAYNNIKLRMEQKFLPNRRGSRNINPIDYEDIMINNTGVAILPLTNFAFDDISTKYNQKIDMYIYYCDIIETTTNFPWSNVGISQSVMNNGLTIKYIEEEPKTFENLLNYESKPEPTIIINTENKTKSNGVSKFWLNKLNKPYEPNLANPRSKDIYIENKKILEEWWNSRIFNEINEIKYDINYDINYVKLKYNSSPMCNNIENDPCIVYTKDLIKSWKIFKNYGITKIDKKITDELNKIEQIFDGSNIRVTPSIPIRNSPEDFKNQLHDIIIKSFKTYRENSTITRTIHNIGDAQKETIKLGYNVKWKTENIKRYGNKEGPCRYLSKELYNFLRISKICPTQYYCSLLPNGCVCYGSQIIPNGIDRNRTQYKNNTDIYSVDNVNDPQLNIQMEHIAHFIQMMFYGGSSSDDWIKKLPKSRYITDGIFVLRQIRALLYDYSIELFNQWKYNQELFIFRVYIDGGLIKVKVDINYILLNKILYQMYFGKQYEDGKEPSGMIDSNEDYIKKNLPSATAKKENDNLLKYFTDYTNFYIKYIDDSSSPTPSHDESVYIKQINHTNMSELYTMFNKKYDIILKNLENRKTALNNIFDNSSFDSKRYLLINCTAFSELLNDNISKKKINLRMYDILNYNFKKELDNLIIQKGAGKSKKQKGGTLNKDLVDAVNNFYNLFQFPDDNKKTMDYIAMVEELFTEQPNVFKKKQTIKNALAIKNKLTKKNSNIKSRKLRKMINMVTNNQNNTSNNYTLPKINQKPSSLSLRPSKINSIFNSPYTKQIRDTVNPLITNQRSILVGSSKPKKKKKKRKTLKIKRKDLKTKR